MSGNSTNASSSYSPNASSSSTKAEAVAKTWTDSFRNCLHLHTLLCFNAPVMQRKHHWQKPASWRQGLALRVHMHGNWLVHVHRTL